MTGELTGDIGGSTASFPNAAAYASADTRPYASLGASAAPPSRPVPDFAMLGQRSGATMLSGTGYGLPLPAATATATGNLLQPSGDGLMSLRAPAADTGPPLTDVMTHLGSDARWRSTDPTDMLFSSLPSRCDTAFQCLHMLFDFV